MVNNNLSLKAMIMCFVALCLLLCVSCVSSNNVVGVIQNANEVKMIGKSFDQVEKTYGPILGITSINDVPLFSFEKTGVCFIFDGISTNEAMRLFESNQGADSLGLSSCACIAVQGKLGAFRLGDSNIEQLSTATVEKEASHINLLDSAIYQLSTPNDVYDTVLLCKDDSTIIYEDEIRIVEKNIHLWKDPSCTDPAVCLYCFRQEGNGLGHKWSEWKIEIEPTCTNDGTEKRVCLNDNTHVETRIVPQLEHDWSEWLYEKEATCTDQGVMYRVCANDNAHIERQAVPALGHKWIEETYDHPMRCERCGQEKGQRKGYVGDLPGTFSDEKVTRGSQWTYPYVLSERIDDCMRLTMSITFTEYSGYAWDKWVLFARNEEGKWNQVGIFNVSKEALENRIPIVVDFVFEPFITFDALMWQKASDRQYSATWDVSFSDAQRYIE